MQNEKLLYSIIWNVAKTHRIPFEEVLGEGYIAWIIVSETFDNKKGKIGSYMWAGISSLIRYSIRRERSREILKENSWADFIPARTQEGKFEFPEELSDNAKKVAGIALNMYNKNVAIPNKKELTEKLIRQGWKWDNIRSCYKELARFY